jgi:hypothetical protein
MGAAVDQGHAQAMSMRRETGQRERAAGVRSRATRGVAARRLRRAGRLRYTREERIRLACLITALFDHWRLPTQTQAALLGLPTGSPATMVRYRRGRPLSDRKHVLERVGHLLVIHRCLHTLYPQNPELRHSWVSARNRRLSGHSPLVVMIDHGLPGLVVVRLLAEAMVQEG